MELRKINEVIPGMKTGSGLFTAISDPVWAELFTASDLDIYFAGTYGSKYISPYTDLFVNDDGTIDNADLVSLANAVYSIHQKEFERLFADLVAEYDPIENTQVTESVTETRSGSGTSGNTRTLNTTTTGTNDSTTTTTGTSESETTSENSGEGSRDTSVYGFGSVDAVGKDSAAMNNSQNATDNSSVDTSASTTVDIDTTERDTGTITDSGTTSDTSTFSRSYSKHGNIGIMSNIQLIQTDSEYWRTWSFVKAICETICNDIALDTY